jgi:hypothetical protein
LSFYFSFLCSLLLPLSGCVIASQVGDLLDLAIGCPALAVCSLQLVQLGCLVVYLKVKHVKIMLPYVLLLCGLAAHLICRIITYALWLTLCCSIADSIFNRLAWISGAAVLMLLLGSWMDAVHSQFAHGTDRFVFWLRVGMMVLAIAYFLVVIIPLAVYLSSRNSDTVTPGVMIAYSASTWAHVAFQMVLALCFLGYGIALVILLQRANPGEKVQTVSVCLVALSILVVYSLPLAAFMVRPFGGCLSNGSFWAMAYIVPSCLLSLVVFFLMLQYASKEIAAMSRSLEKGVSEYLLTDTRVPAIYDNF